MGVGGFATVRAFLDCASKDAPTPYSETLIFKENQSWKSLKKSAKRELKVKS